MSEPVHVEVEVPPAEPAVEQPAQVVIHESDSSPEPGVSDGELSALMKLQRELDEARAELAQVREQASAAETAAAIAQVDAEMVAEEASAEVAALAEEVADATRSDEPDAAPIRKHWTERRIW